MKTTKALILAGLAVMSLGVGAVNAQGLTPSSAEAAYFATQNRAAASASVNKGAAIEQPSAQQFGSSDVDQRTAPAHIDSDMTDGGL